MPDESDNLRTTRIEDPPEVTEEMVDRFMSAVEEHNGGKRFAYGYMPVDPGDIAIGLDAALDEESPMPDMSAEERREKAIRWVAEGLFREEHPTFSASLEDQDANIREDFLDRAADLLDRLEGEREREGGNDESEEDEVLATNAP